MRARLDSVFTLDIGTDRWRLVTVGAGNAIHSFNVSDDNRMAVFVSGNANWNSQTSFGNAAPSSIVTVSLEDGRLVALTDTSSMNVSPVWTSDRRHVLYISDRGGTRDIYVQRVSGSGAPVGDAVRITTGLSAHSISLSADDRTLAYSSFAVSRNVWSLRLPLGGPVSIREAEQVTFGNQNIERVSLSGDGRWMAFDSDLAGNHYIYRMALPDGQVVRMTTHPAGDFHPSLSFDGSEISFHSYRTAGRDVFVTSATSGSPVQVSNSGDGWVSTISPDGLRVAWRSAEGTYVSTRETIQSSWSVPAPFGVLDGSHAAEWFSSGDSLLHQARPGGWIGIQAAGEETRVIIDPSDHEFVSVSYPYLNADQSRVYFVARHETLSTGIWSTTLQGEDARREVAFDEPAMEAVWPFFDLAGGRVYLTIAEYESDIHVLSLEWE